MAEDRSDFHFPGSPYLVQQKFMQHLYSCLTYCKGGIFQSPTGTGKSLSIICAAFQWLRDEYISRDMAEEQLVQRPVTPECDSASESGSLDYSAPPADRPKVIYCSRTHSQLKQFVAEIQKTSTFKRFKVVTLASRKKLCINPGAILSGDIAKFCSKSRPKDKEATPNDWEINPEGKETPQYPPCPYFDRSDEVTSYLLANVVDIEEAHHYGMRCQSCPYYGTMKAVEHADVILAPYQYLLNVAILKQLSIVDEQTVIIFDEAHNVVDNILDSNSFEKKLGKLQKVLETLEDMQRCLPEDLISVPTPVEMTKYGATKLEAESKTLLRDATESLRTIRAVLLAVRRNPLANVDAVAQQPLDFLRHCSLEPVPLQQLADKMGSYCWDVWKQPVYRQKDGKIIEMTKKDAKRIISVLRFLATISVDPEDHSVILKGQNGQANTIKKLLINPLRVFSRLLASTRCIVLAGGTLDPMSEFLHLFSSLPRHLLTICDCEHVIPPENMEMFLLTRLGTLDLNLVYGNKNSPEYLQAIGTVLEQMCQVVPHGIVVFFSSFDHIARFVKEIKGNGTWERIRHLKRVFVDQRSSGIFEFYEKAAIDSGAILLTVVRGSLSEGINFSGDVGRCAVVVGQPFPNAQDAEMKVKMRFWDTSGGEMTGNQYLTNCCFKAVNQCIGRVIRNGGDYAVVVLLDKRYSFASSLEKLSAWTKRNMTESSDLEQVVQRVRTFFQRKALVTC